MATNGREADTLMRARIPCLRLRFARGEADRTIREAEGYTLNRVNRAKGDASRFRETYEEYRKAKDVTRRRLYLEYMRGVLRKMGSVYIVDQKQKSALPLLNLTNLPGKQ